MTLLLPRIKYSTIPKSTELKGNSITASRALKVKFMFLSVLDQFDSHERPVIGFPTDIDEQAPEALQRVASGGELWRRHWIHREKTPSPERGDRTKPGNARRDARHIHAGQRELARKERGQYFSTKDRRRRSIALIRARPGVLP